MRYASEAHDPTPLLPPTSARRCFSAPVVVFRTQGHVAGGGGSAWVEWEGQRRALEETISELNMRLAGKDHDIAQLHVQLEERERDLGIMHGQVRRREVSGGRRFICDSMVPTAPGTLPVVRLHTSSCAPFS